MAKFTGNKWHVAQGSARISLSVRDGDEWLSARLTCHHVVRSEDSNIAPVLTDRAEDARLIAAAPDMYEILRGLYEFKLELSPDTRNRIGELLRGIDGE